MRCEQALPHTNNLSRIVNKQNSRCTDDSKRFQVNIIKPLAVSGALRYVHFSDRLDVGQNKDYMSLYLPSLLHGNEMAIEGRTVLTEMTTISNSDHSGRASFGPINLCSARRPVDRKSGRT